MLLCHCIAISNEKAQYEYCGNVDVLTIYVKQSSMFGCKDAMAVTDAAYDLLWQKAAGPLNDAWRVEYMYGSINIEDPWAATFPEEHLIRVQSDRPRSIFHELGHAYMYENHSGGKSQHKKMCADKKWLKYEEDFGVTPYCQWIWNE